MKQPNLKLTYIISIKEINNCFLCFFVFFFGSFFYLFSQEQITFRSLSVKDGLSQNSAVSITQDSIGYLWIATQDGLNRYDGRQFATYPLQFIDITRPNFSNLGKLYLDRQNQLLAIPLDRTLVRFNPKTNSFVPLEGVKDVNTIFQDVNLNYWATTYSKEILFIESKTQNISKLTLDQPPIGAINEISEIDQNTLLLLGMNELLEIDIHSKKTKLILPKTPNRTTIKNNFSVMVVDSEGKQWIGTFGNGLYTRENGSNILRRIPNTGFKGNLPLNINVLDLFIDSKNRLWVATYGNGLYMINLKTHEINNFTNKKYNPRSIQYNDILCIYEDYLGTLWFGTDGAGLNYFDEYLEKFNSYTNDQTPENINIDVVRSIAVDNNNETIWAGTSGKGLSRFDPKMNEWKTFSTGNSDIPSNRIMSLLLDNEDLWIGTQGDGLSILDSSGTYTVYSNNTSPRLTSKTIWDIFNDSDGRFWLATNENGLIQFDKNLGEVKKYIQGPQKNAFIGNNVRVITDDKKGNLWLGTDNEGVFQFNIQEEKFKKHKILDQDSTEVNSIKSLWYADNDILWIGTYGHGLIAYDLVNSKYHSFNTSNGLANNVIYSILPDSDGNLWLSSNKGIIQFTPKNLLKENLQIVNYNNYDGLATEFNTGAYFKSSNGTLYFGGLDGLYWFQPKNIKNNTILPKTNITKFEVLGMTQPIREGIELESKQNTLAFTFSSLQFSMPEKNLFQYRLMNYDNDWVFSGNNNYVRYTQLPPGEYKFQVKSSNYDGLWNETPETFIFSIKAPWYATLFAKLVYFLLAISALAGVFFYMKWRWRMRLNLRLKEEESQRLKKLNDFKSNLYTDIAHEFKTPLTLIAGPIEQTLSQENLSTIERTNFSMIKRNANRLTSLVDQLLELAKLENGKLKLNVTQGNLSLFLHTIAQSFEYQTSIKNMKYYVEIESLEQVWYDADIVEKITTNLLSNAFKYSTKNGSCTFSVTKSENFARIKVSNTAINASKLNLDKLFTRFYQYDNYSEGIGVGLSLVGELVKIYGGAIDVSLEKYNVLSFIVDLPIDYSSFSIESIKKLNGSDQTPTFLLNDMTNGSPSREKDTALPILLIVEDHQEVRTFIKLALDSTYKILEAENGKKGLEIALSIIPDIVLTDVRMPVKNGIELCNTLKTDERTSHIPVILLTARDGEKNELKGLGSGADDFITKPFKINLLKRRMANLITTRKILRKRYSEELILKPKDIAITPSDEAFFKRIQQILDKNLSDPNFNAALFSEKAKMSRMQLHRKLQAYTGLSTSAFIRSQRLKQAIQILKSSENLTVSEIAYTVGFNTPTYFMKCFKETFHKTPSEYLNSLN
ncbi:ligand-binding sensor domain-containing protein/signal transduction histidine kinase/DNA-binding response OmpR family regulator [Saonia flava]|uniref:histidine kinase n=1 Tax=Saonia flava TaxID=523696 RepID=A0A846QWG7_9FLAO|nr:two-component regulator propeller domain-containing protein [Saonia flava]NJB71577.1 ligand-binding sensor domain-containing protein/signal transduction histidine kinase/DNA-binding response OmpR family regulator [Saonia flava]